MKTIQIRKDVKLKLDQCKGKLSTNKFMKELLADVDVADEESPSHPIEYANIHMDDELVLKLRSCRLSNSESYSDVISRLLAEWHP